MAIVSVIFVLNVARERHFIINRKSGVTTEFPKLNLNFFIEESPFSPNINLRKSFIKNKNGFNILPPDSRMLNSSKVNEALEEQKEKVIKLELENSSLNETLAKLEIELQGTRNALHEQGIQFEKAKVKTEKL